MIDSSSQPYSIPYFIKYNPALKAEFGSQNAVILFDRLEYWFSKSKNKFYKFIEPCEHPLYKVGDSFSEELGFSHKVFRTAFDKIGIRYISKTAFEKEADPFQGKLFAYYQDRQTKKTIFVRNNNLLKALYLRLKSLVEHASSKVVTSVKTKKSSFKKGYPTATPLGRPHASAAKDNQINTSFKKDEIIKGDVISPDATVCGKQSQIVSDMKDIWLEEIGNRGLVNLTGSVVDRMIRAFEGTFRGSLETWRAHCVKIASSKFLMGDKSGTTYEIRLLVALTEKFRDQLTEGKFELNTRKTNLDQKIKSLEEKVKSIAVKKDVLETQIVHLEDEKKASQKRFIAESRKNLSSEERKTYKSSYEDLMLTEQSGQGSRFRENGWEDTQVQFMFDLFIDKELKKSLGQVAPASAEIRQKETSLFETKNKLQNLYDMGVKALRELRVGKNAFSKSAIGVSQ